MTYDRRCAVKAEIQGGDTPPVVVPIRGDVDGNGSVNSNDAIYLLRYTLMPAQYPMNQSGDMDGNGSVNSNDAIYLLRYTLMPNDYPLYLP